MNIVDDDTQHKSNETFMGTCTSLFCRNLIYNIDFYAPEMEYGGGGGRGYLVVGWSM